MGMKNGFRLGILFCFLVIGSVAFGMFSENSRQGSEPIFSITDQGIQLLNPAPDLGSEGTDGKNRVRVNNLGKVLTPYMFTGRRYDNFPGFYFNRNRYYNPQVGRFISRDPLGFAGGENLWEYCNNRPTSQLDPFGLFVTAIVFRDDSPEMQTAANELWWWLAFDAFLVRGSQFSNSEALFKYLSDLNGGFIWHLYIISHGNYGKVFFAPGKSFGTGQFSVPGSINCPSGLNLRTGFTFLCSCRSAEKSPGVVDGSIAQSWAIATKSPAYGVKGYVAYANNGADYVDIEIPWDDLNYPPTPWSLWWGSHKPRSYRNLIYFLRDSRHIIGFDQVGLSYSGFRN